MLIFYLLFQAHSLDATCPKYSCKPESMIFTPNTCIYSTSDQYYLDPCKTSLPYCKQVSEGNSTCSISPPPPEPTPAYPGEYCNKDSDCLYPQCINNTCIGKHWLEPCKYNYECNVGLYCDSQNVCWLQKDEYSSCENDYECENNMGCNKWNYEYPGECRRYYTLSNKEWVYNCQNYQSNFCSSGNCGGPGGKGICIDGIKPRYLDPQCEEDEDCPGESFGWQYYSTCECGYNGDGKKYCKAFLGDYIGRLYVDRIKDWYNSAVVRECHTDKRASEECMQKWDGYQDYLKKMYYWMYYPQLMQNDECVKEIYTSFYWNI